MPPKALLGSAKAPTEHSRCRNAGLRARKAFHQTELPRSTRLSVAARAAAVTGAQKTIEDNLVNVKVRKLQRMLEIAIKPQIPRWSRTTSQATKQGRGKGGLTEAQQAAIEAAVNQLEGEKGVQAPTASGQLEGRWKLLYTTRPGTASPIQRSFTGVESFSVFQDVSLQEPGQARVVNVVVFGKDGSIGQLRVEAEANTDANPRPGFTPRKGAGLPIFGKSSAVPPAGKDIRIDFQFDRAAFEFKALPFKIPYPVPFKLLGDETKGWIDVTYLSKDGRFRLSRGNKGTLFILEKCQ